MGSRGIKMTANQVKCTPGPIYYCAGAGFIALIVYSTGVLLGAWQYQGWRHESHVPYLLLLGLVGLCCCVAGWHSFVLRPEGLQVDGVRGRRMHTYASLGRPGARENTRSGISGATNPQAYSHIIRDKRGKTLYRIGPAYPNRGEMMRELRRRMREAKESAE